MRYIKQKKIFYQLFIGPIFIFAASSQRNQVFSAEFEMNPLHVQSDFAVAMNVQPVEIVYDEVSRSNCYEMHCILIILQYCINGRVWGDKSVCLWGGRVWAIRLEVEPYEQRKSWCSPTPNYYEEKKGKQGYIICHIGLSHRYRVHCKLMKNVEILFVNIGNGWSYDSSRNWLRLWWGEAIKRHSYLMVQDQEFKFFASLFRNTNIYGLHAGTHVKLLWWQSSKGCLSLDSYVPKSLVYVKAPWHVTSVAHLRLLAMKL